MNVKERLKQFAGHKKIRITALEEASGLSNGYINNIRNSISDQKLGQITRAFPDLDPVWLRMGVGEMIKSGTGEKKGALKNSDKTLSGLPVRYRPIPLVTIEAMAGEGQGDMQEMGHDSQQFVVPTFAGAEFLIGVHGDSMCPKYNSGDIVACKRLSLDTFFQWNKVYVLDTEQGALIKRVRQGKDEGHVLIVSDNEDYGPYDLHRSEIRSIAIVIGVIRLE